MNDLRNGFMCCVTFGVLAASMIARADDPADTAITSVEAQRLIGPFYEALTQRAKADIQASLGAVTTAAWVSCGDNDACQSREDVLVRWSGRAAAVPDLQWKQRELLVSGNKIIVRGEETGTPAGEFQGVPHTGRSFRVMSIDIHTVEARKIVRTHHVEDWATARKQLAGN
jgi:predicted ester cyclase